MAELERRMAVALNRAAASDEPHADAVAQEQDAEIVVVGGAQTLDDGHGIVDEVDRRAERTGQVGRHVEAGTVQNGRPDDALAQGVDDALNGDHHVVDGRPVDGRALRLETMAERGDQLRASGRPRHRCFVASVQDAAAIVGQHHGDPVHGEIGRLHRGEAGREGERHLGASADRSLGGLEAAVDEAARLHQLAGDRGDRRRAQMRL